MDSRATKLDINFLTVSQSFKERQDFGNGVNVLPEELINQIFDYVEPYELLKLSQVCQKWNIIIKQPYLWRKKFQRKYKECPKRYNWFVLFSMVTTDYYNFQPVSYRDARNRFTNWTDNTKTDNNSSRFISPVEGYRVRTMRGHVPLHLRTTSRCTSRTKIYINEPELISFGNNRLVKSIVNAFRPITYVVEWYSCSIVTHSSSFHKMTEIINNGRLAEYCTKQAIESAIIKKLKTNWKEVPILIADYAFVDNISFIHVISVNQPMQERLGDNLIDVLERKPKILASSLPV